ncbi:MAG: hypothetical protein HFJ34_01165 [Clostridia bacterium]|nr:hypothetical protein [Clostridia bacterium]
MGNKYFQKIQGMTVETFVQSYKFQSQMDVNTINGIDVSGRGAKMVGDIHRSVKRKEKDSQKD